MFRKWLQGEGWLNAQVLQREVNRQNSEIEELGYSSICRLNNKVERK